MKPLHELKIDQKHKEDLQKSGLSDKTIYEAHIESVCFEDFHRKLGVNLPGIESMYEIPYCRGFSRFRIFYKEGEGFFKNGERRPEYLARVDAGDRLYIPHNLAPILSDVSTPLYITEGEKETLKAVQEGINCIAIPSLLRWDWDYAYELIPDFDLIQLHERTITIIPNECWNIINRRGEVADLKNEVYHLILLLIERGAQVYWLKLPVSDQRIGLDYYLCNHSREELYRLPKVRIKPQPIEREIGSINSHKQRDIKCVLERIARLPSEIERDLYIKELAQKAHVTVKSVRRDINKITRIKKEADSPDTIEAVINKLNELHAVVMVGGKFWVLNEEINPIIKRPDISLSPIKDFHIGYANKKIGNKNIAALWLTHPNRRQYKGIVFDPLEEIPGYYNLWKGFAVEPTEGDCSLYLQHLRENISGGDEGLYMYIIAWMADAIQNPSERKGAALVLRGRQGVGKGIACSEFGKLFGHHYIHIQNSHHLVGKFNSHLKDVILVFADEAFWAGDKAAEGILRGMITEPYLNIEQKGKDMYQIKNHVHLMIASNNEWVVPAGLEERRFCIIDVKDTHIQDRDYFKTILNQMDNGGREALLYLLQHFDLSSIDIGVIPDTTALTETKILSMNTFQRFWYQKLQTGSQLSNHDQWIQEPVLCKRFQEDYMKFADQSKSKRRKDEIEVGMGLKKVVPEIKRVRVSSMEERAKRYWAYKFPPLEECRLNFEQLMRTEITWPKESGALSGMFIGLRGVDLSKNTIQKEETQDDEKVVDFTE